MLTREQILKAQELRTTEVTVDEWGMAVTVKELSEVDRADFFEKAKAFDSEPGEKKNRLYASLFVCRTAYHPDGQRLFDDDAAHILGQKNSQTILPLYYAAELINGISDAETTVGKSQPRRAKSSSSPSV